MTSLQPPEYLLKNKFSNLDYWKFLQQELIEAVHSLQVVRFQTLEQAIGSRNEDKQWTENHTVWFDDDVQKSIPAWFEEHAIDQESMARLEEHRTSALAMTSYLQNCIDDKQLSPEFAWKWGRLSRCSEMVETLAISNPVNVIPSRLGKAGGDSVNVDLQRRWFAHYFLHDYTRGNRPETEDKIEKLLNNIIFNEVEVPLGTDKSFFSKMLQECDERPRQLKNTFRDNRLSIIQMRTLVKLPFNDLPLLDPKIPLP